MRRQSSRPAAAHERRNGTPAEGVVFTGTDLGTKFRAALLNKAGAEVVSKLDFAIGNLSVSL